MRSYPVKENPIDSAVSDILWYRQTHILTYYKDFTTLFICKIVYPSPKDQKDMQHVDFLDRY